MANLRKNEDGEPGSDRKPEFHLYIDDSGSRHLDKLAATANTHPRWFALGGILLAAEDEAACKAAHDVFLSAWPKMREPLHISDMLARRSNFSWLQGLPAAEQTQFQTAYHAFLTALPVLGTACVIHRPGYLARQYGGRQGDARWDLCRTAFNIVVERAAKVAHQRGGRLRVKYERSNPQSDQKLKGYWALLKNNMGLGFNPQTSSKYGPMDPAELARTLIDLEGKDKRSKLMQVADSFVYAIAKGRYEPYLPIHAALVAGNRIIDGHLATADAPSMGVKYSCFDGV